MWFKRKKYGYGWVPVNFKGWGVLLAYTLITVLIFTQLQNDLAIYDIFVQIILPMIIATAVLISVCIKKGEKPAWQWGEDRK